MTSRKVLEGQVGDFFLIFSFFSLCLQKLASLAADCSGLEKVNFHLLFKIVFALY